MGTDVHAVWQAKKDGKWVDVESTWDQDRHYVLFAWLADVRNGYGFAGITTHDPIKPISKPRGTPPDFDAYKYEGDTDDAPWLGDHSFSWLTADEILAAERPGTIKRSGIVPRAFYDAWDGKKSPEFVERRYLIVVAKAPDVPAEATHVEINWTQPDDGLDYFVNEVSRMKALHGEVRLVFGFD